MSSETELREICDEATPLLEHALRSHTSTSRIDRDLQLYMPHCRLATAALQLFLHEKHGIGPRRLLQTADLPRGQEMHVVLRDQEGVWIDPTHGQFLSHIGLTHRAAIAQGKTDLYPTPKIAVFAESDTFADAFARHVFEADAIGVELDKNDYYAGGEFKGEPIEKMRDFYRRLWSQEASDVFLLRDEMPYMIDTAYTMLNSMTAGEQNRQS